MKCVRLILVLVASIFLAPMLRAEPKLADGIQAIVNDKVITFEQVREFIAPAVDSLQQQYAGQPTVYSEKLNALFKDGLEQLIERALILHSFDAVGYKLPDSIADELVQDRIRDRFGDDRVSLMKTLQAQGMTYADFRQEVLNQWIEAQMRRRNVSQEIVISPFKVENYYLAHQDDFKTGDEIQLQMILLNKKSADDTNTLALANEILSKIKAGASFQEMAKMYSQGSNQKSDGDRYERSALRKELADVAFALKAGQVSDVIDTPEADYIIFVQQTFPAHVQPIAEVRDYIENTLRTQEQSRIEKQWIDGLKKKSFIRIIP